MRLAGLRLAGLRPPTDLPVVGGLIPGVALRGALVLAGGLLSLADYGPGGWLVVGVLLSLAAACYPHHLVGWLLILFLAAGRLAHHADRTDLSWRFLVLLAGLHLLQVLSLLTLELPARSWFAATVLLAPLRRLVVIQIPTQLFAVVTLLLLAPSRDGHRPLSLPGIAVIGALGLAGLALLLIPARLDRREPSP